jgi:hypothetical protein
MQNAKKKFEKAHNFRLAAIIGAGLALLIAISLRLSFAQKFTQQTFASPEEASRALVAAVQRNDDRALMRILGGGKELVSSGDELEDKFDRKLFVQKYRQMHRLVREADLYMRLYIGAENWPFPVPLAAKNGRWCFDSKAGAQEILFRRIGENESIAIAACHALVLASKQHDGKATAEDPIGQYARTLVNDQVSNGGAAATKHQQFSNPFYGYYYRILTRGRKGIGPSRSTAGGLVFVAYPARYRSTGVMTFVVSQDNVVYEKDLGRSTTKIAAAMTEWKLSSGWHVAERE